MLLGVEGYRLRRPFKIDGETIDFDEVPELKDPVNLQKNYVQDLAEF